MFAGDHHQHVVAKAHVLAIEEEAAAVELALALLEILGIAMNVVSVHIFNHVDTVWCQQVDYVLEEDNSGLKVVQAVIDDQVKRLWLCIAFEAGDAFGTGLIHLIGLNATVGEQAFLIDIDTSDLGVGKVISPDAEGCAGFSFFTHVGQTAGVVGADAALQHVRDRVAAMVKDHAVEVGVGVRLPVELSGFRTVSAFVAAVDITKLRQIAVLGWRIKRFNALPQVLLYRCSCLFQFGFGSELTEDLVKGERACGVHGCRILQVGAERCVD